MKKKPDRVWVEINLDHIAQNVRQIKEFVGTDVMINGIIKADGYGHGVIETAKILCENKVAMLSTATLDEALQLRKEKIDIPLMVLGYTDSDRIEEIIENDITISVFSYDLAKKMSEAASRYEKNVKVHLKIDTGMNRIGFHYTNPESIFQALKLDNLEVLGIFTHFSKADEKNRKYTDLQYSRFTEILSLIEERGYDIKTRHSCNSGGVILHKDKHMNMVRPGIILFGLYPSEYAKDSSTLKLIPAMTFKSRVIEIKEIESGQPVSYGGKFVTERKTRIATIACGYADGFSRQLSSKVNVSINGCKVPVIGNICMDMCMADITGIDVKEGDEVILFDDVLTVERIAELCGTINYEIICKIGMRVPRVYFKNGKIVKIQNYLL